MGKTSTDDGFSLQVKELQELVDPKDVKKLLALGGLEGVRQKLKTDLKIGLVPENDEMPEGEVAYGHRKRR